MNDSPLIPGDRRYAVRVTNDSAQQETLVKLVGPRRQEKLHIKVRAQLALQDDDPCVVVSINGQEIGTLSRTNAQALNRIVRYGKRSTYLSFECAALIHGTVDQLGVRLDLPFDNG